MAFNFITNRRKANTFVFYFKLFYFVKKNNAFVIEISFFVYTFLIYTFLMKDAINNVGERLELPRGWLNDDFKKTDSYSPKLFEVSKY